MDQDRYAKLEKIVDLGVNPYPDRYDQTHHLDEALKQDEKSNVKVAGRMMTFRDMGKITFAHLQDQTGRMQIVFQTDVLSKEQYDFLKLLDLGDVIGVEGEIFVTKKGETSVLVKDLQLLSKCLRPLPEKWHGLKDKETAYRQRYLDLMTNRETMDRFMMRSKFIQSLREFYWQKGFVEIETPILAPTASGALATPFTTHHNALDHDFYLRIAIETDQKKAIVGGFEKTFELGKVFRNEGMDPSHLQEFTACEHYAAYWNYEDNMSFTEEMFHYLLDKTLGTRVVKIADRDGKVHDVDFGKAWNRVSMRDLIKGDCGIDIAEHETAESLLTEMKKSKIEIDGVENLGRGNLIDQLYKKVSRPKMIQPTFLMQHPVDVSPLARRNDDNPMNVDRFQLVVNGWEIVNAYSELVDPVDQAGRFEDQSSAKEAGDEDAHGKDDDFVKAMEYGMPPQSGWGMGIDRIVALLTQQNNLKDVVMFPLLRPETKASSKSSLSAYDNAVVTAFPGLKHAISVIEGVNIKDADPEVLIFVSETLQSLNPSESKENSKKLKAYKKLFKGFGVDPSKKKPSPIALIDRLSAGKDFPKVNSIVDIYNALVVKHECSIAAFDRDKIQSPLTLRFSKEGDEFQGIGTDIAMSLKVDKLCYFDGNNVCITQNYNYRDSDISKVDTNTNNLILVVDGNKEHSLKDLEIIMGELQELVLQYCGGTVKETHYVSAS
jgi:lysyl-tRNA synthetase class 2